MNIQPVIVVYNVKCADSVSVVSLLAQGGKPLIVDNSTSDYGNAAFCAEKGLRYLSMNGNAGLSRAYNRALDALPPETDFVLWLDDDTVLPETLLRDLADYVRRHPGGDVYVPVVRSAGGHAGLVSPSILKNANTYRIRDVKEIGDRPFSAINSGMLVARRVYDSYRYDERIFLDCLDHDFICDCWENGRSLCLMENITLYQHFSGDEKGSKTGALKRFSIFRKDFRIYRGKHACSRLRTEAILLRRRMSILLK